MRVTAGWPVYDQAQAISVMLREAAGTLINRLKGNARGASVESTDSREALRLVTAHLYRLEVELKQQTADLIEDWRAIYRYLGRCNTNEREHLRRLSQDISQAIYELRAPLEM